jgi:hypothetical protein
MNRFMPVMNGVIPVNEPMTPMKAWVGDPKRSGVFAVRPRIASGTATLCFT